MTTWTTLWDLNGNGQKRHTFIQCHLDCTIYQGRFRRIVHSYHSIEPGLIELIQIHICRYIQREYFNPCVLITRIGWSDDGQLADYDRIDYLRAHLEVTLRARNDGCNILGFTGNGIRCNEFNIDFSILFFILQFGPFTTVSTTVMVTREFSSI